MRWTRAVGIGVLAALMTGGVAQAATNELPTSSRLQDRREVAAGTRAYSVGFEDGRFYANGWHITGEMGGVWAPPLKLVDGVWFGVDRQWVGPATRFYSGWGYTRYDLPPIDGLALQRTDFAPDGRRGALFGLKLSNPRAHQKTVKVMVDAHSELMTQWPWGEDPNRNPPTAKENAQDTASYDKHAITFRDTGQFTGEPAPHHYTAIVGSDRDPLTGTTGPDHYGPQGGRVCPGTLKDPMPSQCDDGPYGRGTGGQLRYNVKVPGGGSTTVWIAVAGSENSAAEARSEFAKLTTDPAGELAAKMASRQALGKRSQVSLPGDPLLQQAIDWGKQNLADLTQTATGLQIRWTNQGKQYPPPSGTVPKVTWIGAGFPDYPWIFATDAEYTAFASVALGQFESIKAHMRALRDISEILNPGSGVVVHETVSDGSVYFGKDTTHQDPTTGTKYDFNTDETVKFPSAVALIWRWTGDNAFRDDLYGFAKRNLEWVSDHLDADHDGWPEGLGNVERGGMGEEKLDNTVYYIRGLYDLADMARANGNATDAAWAKGKADSLVRQFEGAWWMPAVDVQQYADSLDDPGNVKKQQKHWIGVTPMDAELALDERAVPGLAQYEHAQQALAQRETTCYSGERPGNRGLFHTGCGGGEKGQGEFNIFSLTTSIQAVGEGNYGRLGPDQQGRYTDANAETMFSEPATGGTPDEQPGAMPEIFPSVAPGTTSAPPWAAAPNIDRCWTCRSMFMQAWGNYGTAWSVIHQQLGVRPDLGRRRLEVVPQVPDGQPSVQGDNIRLGTGALDVHAAHDAGPAYTTEIDLRSVGAQTVRIGHTLPRGTQPASVLLDGHPAAFDTRDTNRGTEVTVPTSAGDHTLVITV